MMIHAGSRELFVVYAADEVSIEFVELASVLLPLAKMSATDRS